MKRFTAATDFSNLLRGILISLNVMLLGQP